MERNIDSMGRVVIPSEFRKQLKISDGDLLNMEIDHNGIFITKVNNKPSDIRRERFFTQADLDLAKQRKAKYPSGTLVECIEMRNESFPVPSGTHGVVSFVDDIGTIHVNWENGSSLALLEDVDRFKIIK
jgi:AbrB family looped-hinge helix DNA binding protein